MWSLKGKQVSGFAKAGFSLARFGTTTSKQEGVKTAILMLNMGGPQTTDQVPDYLLRIMTDRDMIQLPVQSRLGPWIAQRRAPEVQKKYHQIGGGSPILKWTELQGELMCKELDRSSPETAPHKHYVGFRYVDPLTESTLEKIEKESPERVVIFSQYPQYSCATSGSSFNSIYYHYRNNSLPKNIKWGVIDRWGTHPLLIKTFADRIRQELNKFCETKRKNVVILFTAHSLPLKAVNRGDPYPSEIGASVHMVMQELGNSNPYSLAWQSKVGPLPWLAPATDDAIKGYVKQGLKNFILVPIAFVNEHIETLHELDIEYCDELAKEVGVEEIRRAAAPNDHPLFINALSAIVLDHLHRESAVNPKFLMRCPMCTNPRCRDSKRWLDYHKQLPSYVCLQAMVDELLNYKENEPLDVNDNANVDFTCAQTPSSSSTTLSSTHTATENNFANTSVVSSPSSSTTMSNYASQVLSSSSSSSHCSSTTLTSTYINKQNPKLPQSTPLIFYSANPQLINCVFQII